eukprot:1691803-Rhodomonas_salina.2
MRRGRPGEASALALAIGDMPAAHEGDASAPLRGDPATPPPGPAPGRAIRRISTKHHTQHGPREKTQRRGAHRSEA